MALTSTIYRFTIQLSDVDRGIYQTLELRVARHPSESEPFLLTRLLAYALNVQEGLEFSRGGISSTDDPALWVKDLTGSILLWIEVGNPSARRLHKASKASPSVRIYTHRDPKILRDEIGNEEIYRRESIEVVAVPPAFLRELGQTLDRDNKWQFLHTEGEVSITCRDRTCHGELATTPL